MKQRFLWVEVYPRLLGGGIFAYLIYSLVFKAQALTSIHAWMATLMLILVVLPMANRLKISNWFDFSAKLDTLQKQQSETKQELYEVKAQLSNVVEIHAAPVQQQTTIVSLSSLRELAKEAQSPVTNTNAYTKDKEQTRQDFLRKADIRRSKAHGYLFVACHLHAAMIDHKGIKVDAVCRCPGKMSGFNVQRFCQ